MARYVTKATTDWDQETAFAYLAEFSSVADWDPSVVSAKALSEPGLQIGTRFEVVVKVAGRETPLIYEVVAIDPPNRVSLRAETGALVSLDTMTFAPDPGGTTEVTYDADLSLKGALRMLDPALGVAFKRIGEAARDGLRKRLADPAPARLSTAVS